MTACHITYLVCYKVLFIFTPKNTSTYKAKGTNQGVDLTGSTGIIFLVLH